MLNSTSRLHTRTLAPTTSPNGASLLVRPCMGARSSHTTHQRAAPLNACYLGLDFGTSGARATVIDDAGSVVADSKLGYGASADRDWAAAWERVLWELLEELPADVRAQLASVAIDGTSATALLVDRDSGRVLAPPKLYNEAQAADIVTLAKAMAPPAHTAVASTSTLCKLLTWRSDGTLDAAAAAGVLNPGLLHQADWLASLLHGRRDVTDWNNALKLGFDPEAAVACATCLPAPEPSTSGRGDSSSSRTLGRGSSGGSTAKGSPSAPSSSSNSRAIYPAWLAELEPLLPPFMVAPGAPVACVTPQTAQRAVVPADCLVCGGTTDSIAAFVAAGVGEAGEAVTSLGSTMAVKLLSEVRVDDAAYGVYSHRLGNSWLVGGASNTGGAVLRQHFDDAQLRELTARMDITRPSGLDYYPLTAPGERFPVNDPGLQPRLAPRPADDALFLQGMLEGMSRIEAEAYALLARLGATPLKKVLTAGGGAANDKWTALRAAALGVPVAASSQGEASYGAALLARSGRQQWEAAAAAAAAGKA